MIRYASQKQLSIEEFKTPFQTKLDLGNRWVKLAQLISWDELANIYHKTLNTWQGGTGGGCLHCDRGNDCQT